MQNIKVTQGQWLGDIAVREAGTIEALFDLAVQNNVSITDDIEIGTVLQLSSVTNRAVVNYFERYAVEPATAQIQGYRGEGIEFWFIERDFIVS
ncbi:hypothetical protein [Dysgonomonas sp. ZJ279]|uniref:hypothetical protein n=1 Tax=Dysgonomonas sp. ZJ279 TaxID=2709796 RepID=UPI0013ED0A05|nr:hypothetical protein [Dysgonomonas sp. ZJ279]